MSITTQFPHTSPSLIEAIERAYDAVWSHMSSDRDQSELKILLSQTLVALAANDMTDPKERRRKALETMALRS
jgi:hypothetical protein